MIATSAPIPTHARSAIGAAYPQPALTQRTRRAFDCADPGAVRDYLIVNGYTTHLARSAREFARMRRRAALVVLFLSGAVLLQGRVEPSFILLSALCEGGC